eukprot:8889616-Pyramimonas_sp.AAC.1
MGGTFGGAPYGATKRCTGCGGTSPYEATKRCTGCAGRMRAPPLGPRWRSLWGHEALYWVWRTHAGTPTGALGGAPCEATKRCTECGGRVQAPPLWPS